MFGSDILIILIMMLLRIAFQKRSALFIYSTLCLRSLYGGVIEGCSLPLYTSRICAGVRRFVCVGACGFTSVCLQSRYLLQHRPTRACWIMHGRLPWKNMLNRPQPDLKVWVVAFKSTKLALHLASTYETREEKHCSALWQMSSGLVQGGSPSCK